MIFSNYKAPSDMKISAQLILPKVFENKTEITGKCDFPSFYTKTTYFSKMFGFKKFLPETRINRIHTFAPLAAQNKTFQQKLPGNLKRIRRIFPVLGLRTGVLKKVASDFFLLL